jgi:SpoVK/Ycf46/Vps4 family AAA+-type ATPase
VTEIVSGIGSMIGMSKVKQQVNTLIATSVYNRRREAEGLPVEQDTKHMIFVGNPGTGKTEIARSIAPLYKALGLVPSDKFVAPKKSELIGTHLGETQTLVQEQFDKARGGVLFIDEAYALVQGKDDMYGRQAVDTLLELMENHRDDTVVILAGYPKQMGEFLATNPGLESRFTTSIEFPDYSSKDLTKIAGLFFKKGDYKLDKRAAELVGSAVSELGEGNARNARNIVQAIRQAHVRRVANAEDADLTRITAEDVELGVAQYRAQRLRAANVNA